MSTEEFKKTRQRSRAAFDVMFKQQPEVFELESLSTDDCILGKVSSASEPSIYRYHLKFKSGLELSFIGKWKSRKVIMNGAKVICCGDIMLLTSQLIHRKVLGFNDSEFRENIFYKNIDANLRKYLVDLYWHIGDQGGTHFLAMEEVKGSKPKTSDFSAIIDAITDFHAKYYGKKSCIEILHLNNYSEKDYGEASKTLLKMWRKFSVQNDVIFTTSEIETIENFVKNIGKEYAKLPKGHKTLTHNDFTTRNIIMRDGKVVILDWEMACWQNPEHDLIELLACDLGRMSNQEILDITKKFRKILAAKTGHKLTDQEFIQVIRFSLLEFAVNKMSVLRAFNLKAKLPFLSRIPKNVARLIRIYGI